jgi:hypothetical protein
MCQCHVHFIQKQHFKKMLNSLSLVFSLLTSFASFHTYIETKQRCEATDLLVEAIWITEDICQGVLVYLEKVEELIHDESIQLMMKMNQFHLIHMIKIHQSIQ